MDNSKTETLIEDELDTEAVKRRSVTGVVALISRTLFLQILGFVATFFFLSVLLLPEEFGIFYVISAVVNFLIYFSDIGLAAALIQKKEEITEDDLATTFTIQQLMVTTLVIASLLLSSTVARLYHLTPVGLVLFRSLIVAFFLSSLKTIPSVILERKLQFNKLIIPQIVENVVFYGTAVYLAWKGKGVESFTAAVLLRGFTGLMTMYILQPWLPRFAFNRKSAKELMSYGIPFQANSLLSLIKDDLLTAYLGFVLPFREIGFIGWAKRWTQAPLRFFSDSVIRVTFPAFSRLQHDRQSLKSAVEKSLFAVATLVFPAVIGLVSIFPALTKVIARYTQWQPALIALSLFGVESLLASISTTLTNTLNATGYVKITLRLMILWTVLVWVLTPILVSWMGFNGVAVAAALVASTSMIALYLVKRIVPIDILPNLTAPLISTALMGSFVYSLSPTMATSIPRLFLLVLLAAILYAVLMLTFAKKKVLHEMALIVRYLKKP